LIRSLPRDPRERNFCHCTIFAAVTLNTLDNLLAEEFLVETFLKCDEKSFPHGKKFRARMLTRIYEDTFSQTATKRIQPLRWVKRIL
jgi:hypothetical protein